MMSMWVAVTGFIQAFFLSFFLIRTERGSRRANYWLAAYLAVVACYLLFPQVIRSFANDFPHLIAVGYPLLFLTGPLLFVYTRTILSPGQQLPKRNYYHFIPAGLVVVFLSDFYLQTGKDKLTALSFIREHGQPLRFSVIWCMACIHIIMYLYICYKSAKAYNIGIKNYYSSTNRISLKWLEQFSWYNLLLWCIYSTGYLLVLSGIEYDPLGAIDQVFTVVLAVYIYFLSYTALQQPDLFPGPVIKEFKIPIKEKQNLTADIKQQYQATIDGIISTQKPYLSAELTLHDLSDITQIPARTLSMVLRELYQSNFYDFINSHRINEVKLRLKDPAYDHLTIVSIAYECGFNSKTAFNEAFKKFVSMTPTAYKKSK